MNPEGSHVKGAAATPADPGEARIVVVGGGEVSLEEGGNGVPLVLLHGFPLASAIFDAVRPGLSQAARLITPDLPGFGRSAPLLDASMEGMARAMLRLLEELGVERAVLGGHSMGGYVALRMAALARERVLGLVLVATRAAPDGEAAAATRRRGMAQIAAGGREQFLADFAPLLLGASTRARAPRLLEELRDLAEAVAPETLIACQRGMLERPDSRALLASLGVPVLVLAGAEDELIPAADAQELAALAGGATLVVIPGCGHTPSVERPIATTDAIAGFLAAHFPQGG